MAPVRPLIASLALFAFACAAGCSSGPSNHQTPAPPGSASTENPTAPDTTTTVEGTGTIRYQDISGGFYGIVGDDGKQYDPTNLPADLQKDGQRVRFRARILRDQASIRMWGQMVELTSTERLP